MHATDPHSPSLRLSILGLGRVGANIARHAHSAGVPLGSLVTRTPQRDSVGDLRLLGVPLCSSTESVDPDTTHLLVAVPDPWIASVAAPALDEARARGWVVAHCSGLRTSHLLCDLGFPPSHCGSLHPIQSFAHSDLPFPALRGISCGLEGSDRFVESCLPLVRALGWNPLRIPTEHKAAYHAACVMVGNFPTLLVRDGVDLLVRAGITSDSARSALARMLVQVGTALLDEDVDRALTGPAVRGDTDALEAHREALDAVDPEMRLLYDLISARIQRLSVSHSRT